MIVRLFSDSGILLSHNKGVSKKINKKKIDFGCVGNCDSLMLLDQLNETGTYKAIINGNILEINATTELIIPTQDIPENTTVEISLFEPNGHQITFEQDCECFGIIQFKTQNINNLDKCFEII